MITYNHEKFIAQAIESVLMQKTDFDFELVIGEDCSTDQTREIVIDYQKRYPEKIRLLSQQSRLGMHENFARTLQAGRGQYLGLLEGDDYWTSPHKLQRQADFLDSNLDCTMCFHPVYWIDEDTPEGAPVDLVQNVWPRDAKPYSTIEDLLKRIFIQTGSVMLRNGILKEYPRWISKLRGADWSLFLLYAHRGLIGCINEPMGAYRKHSGGITHLADDETIYTWDVKMYTSVNKHFKYEYASIIYPILIERYFQLAVLYDQSGRRHLARNSIAKNISISLLNRQRPALASIKMLLRLLFPYVYSLSKRINKGLA